MKKAKEKGQKEKCRAEEKTGRPKEDQVRRSGGQTGRASGHTSPAGAAGSRLLQQAGRVARGLQLGQPLLHAAEVAVEPPGSAELGQTVLLVGQQGALRGVQGAEGHLQGDQSVEETGARLPEPEPCPCQEAAAARLHLTPGDPGWGEDHRCWGAREDHGDLEARLPTLSSWLVLSFAVYPLSLY